MTAAGLTAACSPGAIHVAPPVPASNSVTAHCARLGDLLPSKLDTLLPRVIKPKSPLTHAWGSHAVVLRCGVPTPPAYDPSSSQTTEVNGVSWFEEVQQTAVHWTAIRDGVNVELTVPKADAAGPYLVALTTPIKRALP